MSSRSSNADAGGDFTTSANRFAESVAGKFSQPGNAWPRRPVESACRRICFSATGQLFGLNVVWRTEVRVDDIDGRPDIGITTDGLLAGHVELKRPGLGARAERFTGANRNQWEKFKALPNLIYTDGSEWSLYRSGELKKRVRIADDVSTGRAKGVDRDSLDDARELLRDFLYWEPVVPSTADSLARFLAPLTRVLRDEVRKALGKEGNPLKSLVCRSGVGYCFQKGMMRSLPMPMRRH